MTSPVLLLTLPAQLHIARGLQPQPPGLLHYIQTRIMLRAARWARMVRARFGKEIFKDQERAAESEYMRAQDAEKMRRIKAQNQGRPAAEESLDESHIDDLLEQRERLLTILEQSEVVPSDKLIKRLLHWKLDRSGR